MPAVARMLVIPRTVASMRGVLLTFDDGPHPNRTPAVLAALEQIRAPAVFFLTGENAARHPGLVREIVAAGHEVGVQGYRHHTRLQWSRRRLDDDTRRALDAVGRAAGVAPRLYRPPHGVVTVTGLRLVRARGLELLLWSRWGRDWERRATASSIARRASAGVEAGDVLLLHDSDRYSARDSWRATVAALPLIVENIATAGLAPAAVSSSTPG